VDDPGVVKAPLVIESAEATALAPISNKAGMENARTLIPGNFIPNPP
jgi:hypothetical protein